MQYKERKANNLPFPLIFRHYPFVKKEYFAQALPFAIFIQLFLLSNFSVCGQNAAVSSITTDWWPQNNQDATNFTNPDGWYYQSTPGSETLAFDGTVSAGTAIATQFGLGPSYTSFNLKFNATIPSTEENIQVILGVDNSSSNGLQLDISKYGVRALPQNDYANAVWLMDAPAYQAVNLAGGLKACEINVTAGGQITVSVGGYLCPTTYHGNSQTLANPFVFIKPGKSGFRLNNVIATKGGITKKFFGNTNPPLAGTFYIDAENGNDLSTGRSEAQAWKTFAHVNATLLAAGTKILLKKGSVWNQRIEVRGAGTVNDWISIGSYGTGAAKPKISLTNDPNDIGVLICDLDKTAGTSRSLNISYIEIKDLEISNTRLGIFYRSTTGSANTGFRVSNVTFNNINCDEVMAAINTAADKNAAITTQLAAVKGNLETVNGTSNGGALEYVFPAAIMIGGKTMTNQRVSGTHTTVLTEFEVKDCQFNQVTTGIISWFYWPFVSGMGADAWRQIVNKVKLTNISSTGIVNGVIAFDGVNGGGLADANGGVQPDPNGWGLIKNVNTTMGSTVPGRTWPNGTTAVIINNSQKFLFDSCEFSNMLNQGNPDGCGFDFESNNNLVTIQNTKFLNNDGHSILLMNGGQFGGNTNLTVQKNLFAGNIKSGVSTYELYWNATNDQGGTHANVKLNDNILFLRKKNINNQSIRLYDVTRCTYVTAKNNTVYTLDPTGSSVTVSFLGVPYTYNVEGGSVSQPGAFKAYPNPTTDNLTIETNAGNSVQRFDIMNTLGQRVYSSQIIKKAIVNLSQFPSGYYFIKLSGQKSDPVKRIFKQ
jgi:hypothetical protein